MTSERLWIAVLALTALLAGGAGGLLYGMNLRSEPTTGPFAIYSELLAREYGLDEAARGRLRQVLLAYEEDVEARIEELKERQLEQLEPELIAAGELCRRRIRRFVIPTDRLLDFDRAVAHLPPAPPTRTPSQ